MNVYVGIDLGSTTTKAVILDEGGEVLGRGITNSRSNYSVAAKIAGTEATIHARFSLLERELGGASPAELERAFRLEQYLAQLAHLREVMLEEAAKRTHRDLSARVEEILVTMEEAELARFAAGEEPASNFFRDRAGADYARVAERRADRKGISFDVLLGVYDRAILRVENAELDLSFEGNILRALARLGGGDVREAVHRVLATELTPAGQAGTGYGRARLPFPKEQIRSEILCHGLGAHAMFPDTRTVLDIGGQDTKAIQVDAAGIVTSFQMNDRCAAGCGRYLGYIADEMNLGLHELGPLADKATRPVRVNSTCTVFAGAELRDRIGMGEKREDILAGLHRAIMLRAMSLLARSGGVNDQFTFTGGVARNSAAVRALRELVEENYGARTLNISTDSIFTGALGAALFALRDAQKSEAA
ncbi:MAG: BadF/BadG/BcrA/BcrD ATPase family protein [Myxococcota bacterium]